MEGPGEMQKRSVSRAPGKKHQTKPPFTESADTLSLERVHVASFLQHRPHFFRWHRSHRSPFTARKITRRKLSEVRVLAVIDTLRMYCPFAGRSFFVGNRTYEVRMSEGTLYERNNCQLTAVVSQKWRCTKSCNLKIGMTKSRVGCFVRYKFMFGKTRWNACLMNEKHDQLVTNIDL